MTIVFAVALAGCCLGLKGRRLFVPQSPVVALVGFYSILALGGYIGYDAFEQGGTSALIVLDDTERELTLRYLLAVAVAGAAGAYLQAVLFGSTHKQTRRLLLKPPHPTLVIAAAVFPMILSAAGTGVGAVLWRDEYLPVAVPALKTAGSALTPCALIALGYVTVRNGRGVQVAAVMLSFLYLVLMAALSTRTLALAPLFFLTGRLLAQPPLWRYAWPIAVAIAAAPVLIYFALLLRGLPVQGLIPLTNVLFDGTLTQARPLDTSIARNVLFGFDLTGAVMLGARLSWADLWVSITPAPSLFTDWAVRSQTLRLNEFTPFNTPGELLNHGAWIALAYFGAAGALLSYTYDVVRRHESADRLIAGVPLLGLGWGFVIQSTQYNLRSCTRLLYYLMVAHVVIRVWGKAAAAVHGPREGRRSTRVRPQLTRTGAVDRPAVHGRASLDFVRGDVCKQ